MPPTGQSEISSLSDSELSDQLKELGVDVGPINLATRRTYERKLLKLRTGKIPASRYQPVDDDDDDDDNDNNAGRSQAAPIERVEPRRRPAPIIPDPSHTQGYRPDPSHTQGFRPDPSHTQGYRPDPSPARGRDVREAEFSPRVESRPSLPMARKPVPLSAAPFSSSSSSSLRKPQQEKSKGFPLWIKLVAVGVVVLLVYLVYCHMEPQAVSNIPGAQNKIEV